MIINVFGVEVQVTSDNRDFLAYCDFFLGAFNSQQSGGRAAIAVHFSGQPPFGGAPLEIFGSDAKRYGGGYRLQAHAASRIQCEVRTEADGSQTILCFIKLNRLRELLNLLHNHRQRKRQLWMTIIRQAVLLPALAMAMVRRPLAIVHASGVARDGQGMLFTGLNGCGKSGLALAQLKRADTLLLSDNFGILDASACSTHAFPEPVRLDATARPDQAHFDPLPGLVFGKTQWLPRPSKLSEPCALRLLATVSIGDRFQVRRRTAGEMVSELLAVHRYLAETPEYTWLHYLYHLMHGIDLHQLAVERLRSICVSTETVAVVLPRAADERERYRELDAWLPTILSKS